MLFRGFRAYKGLDMRVFRLRFRAPASLHDDALVA